MVPYRHMSTIPVTKAHACKEQIKLGTSKIVISILLPTSLIVRPLTEKVVIKYKTIYEFLDAFITLFPRIPLINTINVSWNTLTLNIFMHKEQFGNSHMHLSQIYYSNKFS